MKKKLFSFTLCIAALAIWSCNNSSSSTTSNTDTSNSSSTNAGGLTGNDTTKQSANTPTNGTNTNTNVSSKPLSKNDSMFVMNAAIGGMMEVDGGNVAAQNADNQRVKDFGSMMVTDHSKANDDLKNVVSSKGRTLPTSLPKDKQKMIDAMKNMKGKAFDNHYVSMMLEDHQKDVAEFKKESTKADDPDLKTWITNTLPVLQKHLDSIQAIKKSVK